MSYVLGQAPAGAGGIGPGSGLVAGHYPAKAGEWAVYAGQRAGSTPFGNPDIEPGEKTVLYLLLIAAYANLAIQGWKFLQDRKRRKLFAKEAD